MIGIVDWDHDSSQWLEVVGAARGGSLPAPRGGNALWPLYGPLLSGGPNRPIVIGQVGQSLDGRIATADGHSHYINGPAAIVHLHRLRALVDAVVIGVGTAVADDPQLTVRHCLTPARSVQPARVVIDPQARLPDDAKCLRDDGARRIVVQTCNRVRPKGVECAVMAPSNGHVSPADILARLRGMGLNRILVEGGAKTLSRFLTAGCLDRLHVMVAPLIIGAGPVGLSLPPIARLDAALRPAVITYALPGGDVLFDCALTRAGEGS
jgi:riboflavin-specific deaminase-like protein